nr:IS5/IS1182 family transposase [Oscillospiraceae bacterium]
MTLAEMNDEFGAARTNKKEFLEKMDQIIPWGEFVELVQPFYYKGERGNKPYPLELMLRIFILQNLYDL